MHRRNGDRIITFTCKEEIEVKKLYSLLQELERLLQIFDGVFLDLEAIEIHGRESTNSYNALVNTLKYKDYITFRLQTLFQYSVIDS